MRQHAALIAVLLLGAEAVCAQQSQESGPEPAAAPAIAPHKSGLPFLAGEALARGYELPLPFGASASMAIRSR